jgi:drug/metabolite transporter (DMT)-like permease
MSGLKDGLTFQNSKSAQAVAMAVLAAALYGVSAPVAKLLLVEIPPTLMAALLYLGAGFGMAIILVVRGLSRAKQTEAKITSRELPYVVGMIVLDIMAPIFLMLGLSMTTASNASLLNNFEIVATSLIALFVFKEAIGKRMWIAIALITFSSIILSVEDLSSFAFSIGSIFVLAACLCWGLENNCTRMLSIKDPLQIVVIKGFGSGIGCLIISIVLHEFSNNVPYILVALGLGFLSYGFGIFLYISSQRELGAARTSAYYAAAPFIGVIISWIALHEKITGSFLIALTIMLVGAYLAISEKHGHSHLHEEITHEHMHDHNDLHHDHVHMDLLLGHAHEALGPHSHIHTHQTMVHQHTHTPNIHHRHTH